MKHTSSYRIALVGRPNVGKSTLFNRLVGKKIALVDDTPGVTRDWREAPASLGDLSFKVVDTAGLEDYATTELTQAMEAQTRQALDRADLLIFMVDAQTGITTVDRQLSQQLRKLSKPYLLLVNKCDSSRDPQIMQTIQESYNLGFGEPIALSAEHKEGMVELYQALKPFIDQTSTPANFEEEEKEGSSESEKASGPIQIAVVGRPNVGKSTLINRLIGEERLLTCDMPGVTRDAITVDWSYNNIPLQLIDTAGIRKRAKVTEKLERLSVKDTERAVQFAHVVVLVVDATQALEKQDLTIARQVVEEGRALIIACNKSDLLKDRNAYEKELRYLLNKTLAQVRDIPLVMMSAIKDRGLDTLMKNILEIYRLWNVRLPTGKLNRWLQYATEHHPTPMVGNSRISLKYITQIKSRPPTFAIFASKAKDLPDSYVRYLMGGIRDTFNLKGVPMRFVIRAQKNPYVKED